MYKEFLFYSATQVGFVTIIIRKKRRIEAESTRYIQIWRCNDEKVEKEWRWNNRSRE